METDHPGGMFAEVVLGAEAVFPAAGWAGAWGVAVAEGAAGAGAGLGAGGGAAAEGAGLTGGR